MNLRNDSGVRGGFRPHGGFRPRGMPTPFGHLSMPVFEAEDGSGGGAPGSTETTKTAEVKTAEVKKAEDKKAETNAASERAKEALAAAESRASELADKLKAFEGATPEELKELRALKKEAEEAKRKAADEAKKAEEEKLRAAGNFEALKARMAEEHAKELEGVQSQVKAANEQVTALHRQVTEMALGAAFAASSFITTETVLTPSMARKVFDEHFEVEEGKVVAYDAPRDSAKRVKLVDARGNPLGFDEAMKRIVEASAERDSILKAKQKPGSGVKPAGVQAETKPAEPRGLDRIRMGLGALRK